MVDYRYSRGGLFHARSVLYIDRQLEPGKQGNHKCSGYRWKLTGVIRQDLVRYDRGRGQVDLKGYDLYRILVAANGSWALDRNEIDWAKGKRSYITCLQLGC